MALNFDYYNNKAKKKDQEVAVTRKKSGLDFDKYNTRARLKDEQLGRTRPETEEKQDRDDSKLGAFLKGTGKQYAGGVSSAANTILQSDLGKRILTSPGAHMDLPIKFASEVAKKENLVEQSDKLIQSGQKDIDYVKEDMGGLGKFAVDAGSQGLMMMSDALLNTIVPGAGIASLGARAGGFGASQARAEGATEDEQLLYGSASAVLEMGLEKLFSAGKLMKNMYGKGALNLADATASKAATSNLFKGITKTPQGQELLYNLTKWGFAAGEEGLEEALSDMLSPFLQRAIYSDELEMPSVEEVLRDFALGAVTGGAFGGIGTAMDYKAGVGTAEQIQQNPGFKDMLLNKGLAQNEGTEANAFAQSLKAQEESGKNILGSQLNDLNRMNRTEQGKNDEVLREKVRNEAGDISRIKQTVSTTEKHAIEQISAKKAEDISIDLSKKVAENANLSLGFSGENVEISAISRVMLGTATTADIDTILANPQAKTLLGEELGFVVPMENSQAREMIGTAVAMNARANSESIIKEAKAIVAEDLASTGERIGAKGKQSFISMYPQVAEADSEAFTTIFKRFYNAGSVNIPYEKVTQLVNDMPENYTAVANKYFSPEVRQALYEAGISDSRAEIVAKEKLIERHGKVAETKRKGSFEDQSTGSTLSKPMKTAIEKLAQRTGVNIVYVDTLGNANGEYKTGRNGAYLNGTIMLAADSVNPLLTVAKHELTHHIKTFAPAQYKELEDFVFGEYYKSDAEAFEKKIKDKIDEYKEAGITLNQEAAKEEVLADASEIFFKDESAIDRVIAYSKALGEAILDGIRTVLDSFTAIADEDNKSYRGYGDFLEELGIVEEAERLWMKALEASMTADVKANDGETKYSIAYTKDNRPVAVIEENILENVPEEKWVKTVKEAIKGLRPGVPVGGRFINITRKTAEHFLGSDYTDMVRNKAHDLYEDKFRTAPNLDEVVYASTDYINEDLKHGRWDNIEQFARGKVLLRIGEKNYEASIIVGYTNLKEMLLYDIQDLVPTKFELKEKRYKQHWLDKSYTRKTLVSLDKSIQQNEEKINNKKSLKDTEDRTLTAGQQEYFKNSKVRDAEGRLKVVFHGTPSGEFFIFDKSKGSAEGDFGSGFYFSDNEADMEANYEGGGPDFETKVERLAERIADEEDIDYDEAKEKAREELFKGANRFEVYLNMENPAVVGRTYLLDSDTFSDEYDIEDFDDEEDYYAEVEQYAMDKISELVWEVEKNVDAYSLDGLADVLFEAYYEGGIGIEELKAKINELYLEDEYGNLVGNEVTRQIIESLGYDGIIDPTVASKFKNMGIEEGTTHYIVFKPNQIKYVTNENPTENEDIRFQLKDSEPVSTKTVETLEQKVAALRKEFKRTDLKTPKDSEVGTQASRLIKRYGSSVQKNHTQVVQAMRDIFRIYKTAGSDWEKAYTIAQDTARNVVDDIKILHDETWQEYKGLRTYLKNTGIKLSENDKKSMADYEAFRKSNMGRLRMTDSGRPIDQVYQNLAEEYPHLFTDGYTNGVDQLRHIVDVLDSMKPWYETYDSAEMQDLVNEIAADMLETAYGLQTHRTFADRKAEEKDAAVKKVIQERDAMLARQRERYEEKLARQKELSKMKLEDFKEKQKDRQNRKKAMDRLEKSYKWLKERLLTPSDAKHIPEGYQKAIATLLEGFDFETARTDAYGAKNGLSRRVIELRKFKDMCREIMESSDAGQIEFDPDFIKNLDEITDAIDGRRLADLDTATLDKVSRLLKQLRHQLSYINRAFNEEISETISELGENAINESDSMKRAKEYTGFKQKLDDLLHQKNVTPSDMFELIGGTEKKLYVAMRKGFDRHIQNVQQGVKFVQSIADKKKVKQWENELHTFRLVTGEIQLTTTQLMNLYALMQRGQAQNHILGSGIMSEPVEVKGDKARMKRKISQEHVRPTLEEVLQMTASLTQEQRNVADKLKDFLRNQCSDWGNETSMKLYGYKKFTEDNYFPIKSAKQFLDENFNLKNAETSLKNMGFTKSLTPGANNPIMIDDIFNVFSQHVSKMSMYNALVPAMTDFQRVYNYKRKNEDKLQVNSVQLALEKAYGKKTTEYIEQFMKDLNGAPGARSDADLATELIGRYKKASLGANIRVFLQQPTAIVRAFAVISPKYFSAKPAGKATIEEMQQHCPIAQWKSYGFYNTDVARGMKDIMLGNETIMDKLFMGSYGKADDWAWAQIWKAVKAEVEAENPNLEKGSDEYWQKVNERASEVFDRTQVVDSVFHRSQIMRNKGLFEKTITSFMAEPTKTFNLMRTEFITAQREAASGNKAAAKKRLGRVLGVYALNGLTVSVAAAFADAMRGIGGDGDEDKGTFMQRWFAHSRNNFWANINPLNLLPYTKDIVSMYNGYEVTRLDTQGFDKLINTVTMWQKVIDGSSKYTTAHVTRKTAEAISYVTGVPLANILRDAESASKAVSEVFGNGTAAKFQTAKMTYKVTDYTKSTFADLYYDAKAEGDSKLANEIYRYMKSQGVTEEYIKSRQKTWKKHKDEEK